VDLSCVIVDDNAEFLEAARSLLEREGVKVVGVAATCADALRRVAELRPQVVLVDVDLGGESGFDVTRGIAKAIGTTVILISTHAEDDFAELRPRVVLVDIDLGGESGFDVARQIAKAAGATVILISTHAEDDLAELIAESPAVGFISKSELSAYAIQGLVGRESDDGASAPPGM
jgi:DNA-binding NarL/FixJ family response regulator